MKTFSQEQIEKLMKNPEHFKKAIIDSKGFILYLADQYTIDLPINLLIDSISEYSIRFITEHMRNHKYSSEQIEIVATYLKEDEDVEVEEDSSEYTLNHLLLDLKENNNLPKKAKNLNLTLDDFLNHPNELLLLLTRGGDEYWGRNEFYSSHFLLEPIFKKISKENFLKIPQDILNKNLSFFHMSKHLMNDEDIRTLFNQSVQNYYLKPEKVKGGYKPRLEPYQHYTFKKEEKDFFLSLLKNEYSSRYESISEYKGFSNMFEKDEFILKHNISGIKHFSQKEIANYTEEIQEGIINAYFSRHYIRFEKLVEFDITEDSFKDIFTLEFTKKLIEKAQHFDFIHFDRDRPKKDLFINLLNKNVYKLCADDDNILNLVGYTSLINNAVSMIEHNRHYFDEDYKVSIQQILAKFEKSLTTDVLFSNHLEETKSYSEYDVPDLIFNAMKDKESINYLFFLTKLINTKSWKTEKFLEEINRVISLLPANDVKELFKLCDFKYDKKLLNKEIQKTSTFNDNFLLFTPEIIKTMNGSTFKALFEMSKDFRKMLLQNNLETILIDDFNHQKNQTYGRSFLKDVLSSTKDVKSPYFDFVKSFVKKHKQFMLDNLFNELVTHPLREELIKIDTSELEIQSYTKINKFFNELSELTFEYNKLYSIKDSLSQKEKKLASEKIDELSSKKSKINEDINKELKNISFDFSLNVISNYPIIEAIQFFNVQSRNDTLKNKIFDRIESLSFDETFSLFENKEFLSFIYEHKHNDSTNSKERDLILNPNFSDSQNIEIVEKLLINFNNKDLMNQQYEKEISLSKVLHLIEQKNRFNISNELVIKHDPVSLFCSYDYLPKEEGYFSKHTKNTFTNEQILKAIDNLKAKNLYIMATNHDNINYDNMLSYNFKYEKCDGKNPQLNIYLDLLKSLENDPINYLACIHGDIIGNFIDREKYTNSYVAASAFYEEYINFNVVLKAMNIILDNANDFYNTKDYYDSKGFHNGIPVQMSLKALQNFIHNTYDSNDGKCISEFSEEKSVEIIKLLLHKAPYLTFSTPYIGKVGNVMNEITKNFDFYYHENLINDFFLNSSKTQIVSDHFSLEYEHKNDRWQSTNAFDFINQFINSSLDERDKDSLYQLSFLIKEHAFNEDRPYGKQLNEFYNPLLSFCDNDEMKNRLEKCLSTLKMFELADKLENKNRPKVKSNKI